MPVQPLSVFARGGAAAGRRTAEARPDGGLALQLLRWAIGGGMVATVALGVALLLAKLSPDGLDWIELTLVGFYGLLVLWLAANFWVAAAGFLVNTGRGLRRWLTPARAAATPPAQPHRAEPPRTAVLMPLYNENAGESCARIAAMYRSLEDAGGLEGVHFFLLSDSTDPRCWLEEERLWLDTRRRLGARGRLFYRRREENLGRKPGNIADFCRRWGASYDYMVVLDADSLMAGPTLMELIRRMEAEPGLGLLQTWPRPVNGATLFARAQQFAASIGGPLIVGGMAALAGRVGNYWGHNAIIRSRAFIESCGLPKLGGRPPLGGEIMSHDFVEAALLVRNGWDVRLDAEIGGSYEEGPPNLIESLRRDRRWCQGNLQHLRILPAQGLHPISRVNLLLGIMSFLAAPIWLIFVALAITEALRSNFFERLAELSLTMAPNHGAIGAQLLAELLQDNQTLSLLGLSAALLLGPKILGLAATLFDGAKRRLQGGALRLLSSTLLETLISALVAPLTMLAHSRFIVEILLGRSVGWTAQQRDAERVTWAEAWSAFAWLVIGGLAIAALSTRAIPEVFWWLSPVLLSAALAVPLSVLTGRRGVGRALGRLGLLRIPEESAPPEVLRRFAGWTRPAMAPLRDSADLAAALGRPRLFSLHCALTPPPGQRQREASRISAALQRAEDEGAAALSLDDWRLLLADPDALLALRQRQPV